MVTIPFYNLVVLPDVTMYFQRDFYIEMSQREPEKDEKLAFVMLKEDKERSQIAPEDIYPIGIYATVTGFGENGSVRIQTGKRFHIDDLSIENGEIQIETSLREDIADIGEEEQKSRYKQLQTAMINAMKGNEWSPMAQRYIMQIASINDFAVTFSQQIGNTTNAEKYSILETDSLLERTERIEKLFYSFLEFYAVGNEAQNALAASNQEIYREAAIKKQIEILQEELDKLHPENVTDVRRFEQKIKNSGMNETARAEAEKILNRMKQEGKDSHEYGMLYDYLDFVTGLSWKKENVKEVDLQKAEEILDSEHYGLKKPKHRIIQQLAVMSLNKSQAGSILLFVGAPGTGKTSIGQSIAKALDRKYVRVSLGGVRDEAEIRGHRRTYVGAMPGRIMDGIKKCGTSNPVMVLDEVDKLVRDYNGDPSSALLEVLDPEQNSTFTDHYMNVPYDLSDVLFVCTANSVDTIPEPLLNRMEVIEFQGYTATEKFHIAKKHLLPKSMKSMGIKSSNLKVSDTAIKAIISDYTMEAGVRGLKKCMDTLCRVAAVKLVRGEQKSLTVSPKKLHEYLEKHPIHHDNILQKKQAGIVTGLAWTQAGGDILFIETKLSPGKGNVIITGQLGDVMKESVQLAVTTVKSMFPDKKAVFEENDLHIHVPAGAVPKDGPSAGITLTTALASLISGNAVSPEIAMTGEISLRGDVLPIGGLPEKLMAAQRAGIKTVVIPKENEEDLEDVAEEVKSKLTICPVQRIEEVLSIVHVTK